MIEYALWDSWNSGFLIVFELLCEFLFVFNGWDSGCIVDVFSFLIIDLVDAKIVSELR